MKIIVCIKQVPDTTEVRLDPKTGTMIRDGVPSIINPDDRNALEAALELKDNNPGSTVTLVSMGPPQAELALREALAMGADEAYLISDRAFAGSDTWATSNIIGTAIAKIGGYDIILCGRQAIDGDTAQVGPQIAEKLKLPQVSYVSKIEQNGDKLTVHRALEDGYQVIEIQLPCMLTCIKELNEPRYPSMGGIYDAFKVDIKGLSQAELNIDPSLIGLKSSPTKVHRSFSPGVKESGQVLTDVDSHVVSQLFETLKEKQYL